MREPSSDSEAPVQSLSDVLARVLSRRGAVHLSGLQGTASALVAAELVRAHAGAALFITAGAKSADAFASDLRIALGEASTCEYSRVHAFPRHDTGPYDRFSPQPFIVAQRMDVLARWLAESGDRNDASETAATACELSEPVVVIAPATALALRVPPRALVRRYSLRIAVSEVSERDALVSTLLGAGYARMPAVEEKGEVAVRGGIVDVFPPQRARPVRIEFFGDEVESIREFDPASQRSQQALPAIALPPARELLFSRDEVIARGDSLRALAERHRLPAHSADQWIDTLLRGNPPPGAEAVASALLGELETVFDFLPPHTLLVVVDPDAVHKRLLHHAEETLQGFDAALAAERLTAAPETLFLTSDAIAAACAERAPVYLEPLDVADGETERYALRAFAHDELRRELVKARGGERALAPLVAQLARWREEHWRCAVAVPTRSAAERLRHLFSEYGVEAPLCESAQPLMEWGTSDSNELRIAPLSSGFAFPLERLAVLTEAEIFGPRERRRSATTLREGASLENLSQLSLGDYLVHVEHGIGIYRGLIQLNLGPTAGEFLRIEYASGDRFFLPVHRLNLVQRYAGGDGHAPRIDRLGGGTWQKTKHSVKKSLHDMAKELLEVHAARELAPGHAFSPRDRYLEEFEARFPFEETPDQLAAIEDVLNDLQHSKPMDRLVCGDVGYGKTEVAIRAAFRVAMDGKQVVVLVPTTVLCQQHAETFRKRFSGTPLRIAALSRFQSTKETQQVREGLASGAIDIVIGTHRLLQKGILFRDLGLLVIDEEQRFGVAHKERIKQLKHTVDVLTLTATPIPRTLQLAFTGLRDLSVINTPPADRLAVRTQVCRFSEGLIREAILREVRRGGQVFFLHNRVQSIGAMAEFLARTIPEVRIQVAHGQMPERELEQHMLAFLNGEADVLLCTAIIENGLDIPRANTLIVNRADTFGLAQLYQLRGRVGRGAQRAYAYLMIPGSDALTEDARRRLEAIQDLSELGSGFRLASMDLEIRGAGDLLGSEQSGNLAAVGYETYMEMLEEAIAELRGNPPRTEIDPEIRLPISAQLPEDYVPDTNQRLVLYRRLAGARDAAEFGRIRDELLDRYGVLPPVAENLLRVIDIKIRARELGIAAVDLAQGQFVFSVGDPSRIDAARLVALISDTKSGLRATPDHRILAPAPKTQDAETLCEATVGYLQRLAG